MRSPYPSLFPCFVSWLSLRWFHFSRQKSTGHSGSKHISLWLWHNEKRNFFVVHCTFLGHFETCCKMFFIFVQLFPIWQASNSHSRAWDRMTNAICIKFACFVFNSTHSSMIFDFILSQLGTLQDALSRTLHVFECCIKISKYTSIDIKLPI